MTGAGSGRLARRYAGLAATHAVEPDPAQERVVGTLDVLLDRLDALDPAPPNGGLLGRLFARPAPEAPRGLYVWGSVGRGKTMLMDLFLEEVPPALPSRRVHFHAFMDETHERIFRYRRDLKAGLVRGDDPIPPVAAAVAAEARLLCFDEFAVTDIADAMILGRLFTALFAGGVVLVATSNVEPARLYEGGLNRALFLPAIDTLLAHVEVLHLDARTDYRLEKLGGAGGYVTGGGARAGLDAAFLRLTGVAHGSPRALSLKGRTFEVPEAAMGVARFSFEALCGGPNGPADYLALAQGFHTLVLDDVPVLAPERRDAAKRFITLVDTLYDRGVKLVVSAEAEPEALGARLDPSTREAFEFARTASRLVEMRSAAYQARPHARGLRASHPAET